MTLTEFLLARIAEDEAVAQDLIAEDVFAPTQGPDMSRPHRDEEYAGLNVGAGRVLAECEAKRRIVGLHRSDVGMDPCDAHDGATLETVECDTLRILAAVHADHPDYDEAWAL